MEGNLACNHDFGTEWRETKPEFMQCLKCGLRIGPIQWEVPPWLGHYGQCCEALGLDMIVFGDICRDEGVSLVQAYHILRDYCGVFNKPMPPR